MTSESGARNALNPYRVLYKRVGGRERICIVLFESFKGLSAEDEVTLSCAHPDQVVLESFERIPFFRVLYQKSLFESCKVRLSGQKKSHQPPGSSARSHS